jgi:hypothetical protein
MFITSQEYSPRVFGLDTELVDTSHGKECYFIGLVDAFGNTILKERVKLQGKIPGMTSLNNTVNIIDTSSQYLILGYTYIFFYLLIKFQ